MGGSTRLHRETGGRRAGEKAVAEPTPARPVSIRCRVQAHPSRRELRRRLIDQLDLPTEVIETDFQPPNPWLGYLACLEDPPDCTHLLIVQDDAVPCCNLTPALEKLVQVEYEVPVCLYLGGVPMRTKKQALHNGRAGGHWVDIHPGDWLPIVAVLWPRQKALDFLAWGSDPNRLRQRNGQIFQERSDDSMGGRWMRQTRQRVVATIPSLVEHPDDVPSTIALSNRGRTALFWHGGDWDASVVEWG